MAIISNAVTIAGAGAFSSSLGSMVLIKTLTASSSATLSFVHGTDGVVLDSTYPIYKFVFINIHPSGAGSEFQVGFRDGGTDYDANNTTSMWYVYHMENDSATTLDYNSSEDNATVLIRTCAPSPLIVPASIRVVPLEITATIKPPLD